MNKRVQVVPIVLECPACRATYNLAVSRVKPAFGREEWSYTLPANCSHCCEPLDTHANHVDVRNTARMLL